MERADRNLIEVACSRNILIPQILADGSFYTPVNPNKTQESRERFGPYFSGFSVEGGDNLREAEQLAQDNQITIVDKHFDKLDIIARKLALEQAGFGHLTDRSVYPVELEWAESPELKYWMDADHTVYTIPPQDFRAIDEGLKAGGWSDEKLNTLNIYRNNCIALGRAAIAKLTELRGGVDPKILAVYPEADFQEDGYIRRAPASVSALFSRRDGEYILPILTTGQEQLTSLTEPMEASQRPAVIVRVGKPYPSRFVWDNRQKGVIEPVDLVMASIAKLDPSVIHPDFVEYYRPLIAA